MPELPEVEVVRAGVARYVGGATLARAEVVGHRVARRHLLGPDDLAVRLTGRVVRDVRRRGKYLWLELSAASLDQPGSSSSTARAAATSTAAAAPAAGADDPPDEALVVHLGMSGQLLVTDAAAPRVRHQHATFDLAGRPDAVGRQLRFVDQRTFGGLALVDLVPDRFAPDAAGTTVVPAPVAHIAPDPFEAAFDLERVVAAVRRRDSAIKRALLDQTLVSGIGNIYADEALWRARLHGERVAAGLTRPVVRALFGHVRDVMGESLAAGGTSFDALYVDVDGGSGYFARELAAYGREGAPCRWCGTPLRREAFMNRSSFSCPVCQRRPRARRTG